jgi:hypothetical protein
MSERASVRALIDAAPEEVWDFFRWDNLEPMCEAGLFRSVAYHDRRAVPGATRTVILPDGRSVTERLERLREAGLGYSYTVLNLEDFPLAEYVGTVSVRPVADRVSELSFECEFVPWGISADQWREAYSGMQHAFVQFVRTKLDPREEHSRGQHR